MHDALCYTLELLVSVAWNLILRTAAWECDEISVDDEDEDVMQCKGYPLWIEDYPEAMVPW